MTHFLLSPLTWLLVLSIALFASWRRLRSGWRGFGLALAAVAMLMCTPLGANALVALVESRVAPAMRCASGDASPMVLLSGGVDRAPSSRDDFAALTQASWRRTRGAVDAWRRDRNKQALVIAGGGPHAVEESRVQARLAQAWGVPESMLRTETASATTWDSAFALRGTLPQHIRVASSALHLPRAVFAFRAAGFEPCAIALDSDYIAADGLGYVLPQSSAIAKTERAMYEIVGRLAYAVRARDSKP